MKISSWLTTTLFLCTVAGCGDGCNGAGRAATVAPSPPPSAQGASADAASPLPTGSIAPATGPRLYVSNEDSGDVSVIDLGSQRELGRIQVGKRPRALKLSADQKLLFVALSGSPKAGPDSPERELPPTDHGADGVAVIDLAAGRVVRKLASGADPEQFDVAVDGAHVYVTNEEDGRVSVVDVQSGAIVAAVPVSGEPEGIGVDPGGTLAYVTSETENSVDVVDMKTKTRVAKAPTGLRPRSILVAPDGSRVFISNELGASVTVIDGKKHDVQATIKLTQPGARPMGLALSHDGSRLFVTTGRGKTVAEVDVATASVTRTFDAIGVRPWGIAVSPDSKTLYTANGPSNDVAVIDVETGKVTQRIPVGQSPWGAVLAAKASAGSDSSPHRE